MGSSVALDNLPSNLLNLENSYPKGLPLMNKSHWSPGKSMAKQKEVHFERMLYVKFALKLEMPSRYTLFPLLNIKTIFNQL